MRIWQALVWTAFISSLVIQSPNAAEITAEQRTIQQWIQQAGGHLSDEALPYLNAERTELELDVRAGELNGHRSSLALEAKKDSESLRMGTLFFVFSAETSGKLSRSSYTCIQGADLIHYAWTADEAFTPEIEVHQFLRTNHDSSIDFFGQTERPSLCVETRSSAEQDSLDSMLKPHAGCTLSFDVAKTRKIELKRKDAASPWKVKSAGLLSYTFQPNPKIDRALALSDLQLNCGKRPIEGK